MCYKVSGNSNITDEHEHTTTLVQTSEQINIQWKQEMEQLMEQVQDSYMEAICWELYGSYMGWEKVGGEEGKSKK